MTRPPKERAKACAEYIRVSTQKTRVTAVGHEVVYTLYNWEKKYPDRDAHDITKKIHTSLDRFDPIYVEKVASETWVVTMK